MGSYVLVSHQSQTCSSHRTEPGITTRTPWLGRSTTRTPWLGRSTGSPRVGKLVGTAKPQQPRLLRIGTSLLLAEGVVRIWDASCIKTLQEDVDDEKAERETLLYVGYIHCMYATILFIPRMQIYTIYISIC